MTAIVITESEAGQPDGVATLEASGKLPESQLPPSVVTSSVIAGGEVEGEDTPNAGGFRQTVYEAKQKGNLTLVKPTGWPAGASYMTCAIKPEGHTLKLSGIEVGEEGEPTWTTKAGAINVFTLWTPNGGATVYLFVGVRGKEGEKGEEGARGEAGPSSIEAMLGVSYPLIAMSGRVNAYSSTEIAFRFTLVLVVVPKKAKKLKIIWNPGEKEKGTVRAVVLDMGHIAGKVYSVLAASDLVTPTVKEEPELLATLERVSGEWEPGEVIMVGIACENSEMKLPFGSNLASTFASVLLPENQSMNGIGVITKPYLVAHSTSTEAAYKAGTFAALAESALSKASSPLVLACRWE